MAVALRKRRRILQVALAAGLLGLLFWGTGCAGAIRAARLLRDVQRPADELAELTDEEERTLAGVTVLLYRPRGSEGPLPTVILCHGAAARGARDARFVAFARALAHRGALVATPQLTSLARFRADRGDAERLARVAAELAGDGGQVALLGVSVGGSYCLVAAARPELAGRVSCVLSFGGYENLERLITSWMVDPKPEVTELYDPVVEGRRRVLRGNVDRLVPPSDRAAAKRALTDLLAGRETSPPALGPRGRRVVACAISEEPIDPQTAAALIEPVVPDLRALSPRRAPDAPVFLLHGRDDPIIPAAEAELLRARLEALGARVDSHETALLTHIGGEAEESPSFFRAWPLLRFVARFLSAAGV